MISDKDKTVAGILGITLGAFGIHRMYMGYIGYGLVQLVLTIFTLGMAGLWGFIEGILILVQDDWTDNKGRLLRGNEKAQQVKKSYRIPGDISDYNKGFWISIYNYLTHRNLRFFLSIYFVKAYKGNRLTTSFQYNFFGVFYIFAALFYIWILYWSSYDFGYNEGHYCSSNCGLGKAISMFILWYFIMHFIFPIIALFHLIQGNLTKSVETELILAIEASEAESLTIKNNLRELYVLRSEILDAQKAGIDLGSITDEIEVLENKFVNEAKQNISIEEIAKLQEEFIIGLNPENTL